MDRTSCHRWNKRARTTEEETKTVNKKHRRKKKRGRKEEMPATREEESARHCQEQDSVDKAAYSFYPIGSFSFNFIHKPTLRPLPIKLN